MLKRIVCVALAVAAVVGVSVAVLFGVEANSFKRLSREGFPAEGVYTMDDVPEDGSSYTTLSVVADQTEGGTTGKRYDGWWYLSESTAGSSDLMPREREVNPGYYLKTADRNVYRVLDFSESEVGWMHVAYSSGEREGLLYLSIDGEVSTFTKS